MQYIPKPHQKIAAEFLRNHDRCCLFLDMGLGKTVITLTRIKELLDAAVIRKVLVIAPKRVAESTWTTEAQKWDHLQGLRVAKILGTPAQRKKALAQNADVYVINRDNVQWLIEGLDKMKSWPFDMIVVDELTSFKHATTKRWRMLKRVARSSDYVLGLTGTPAPNGYEDLWAEMYVIDSGATLGKTLTEYRQKYFHPGRGNGQVIYEWLLNRGAKQVIDAKLKNLCLSMTKEDWLQLPPITYNQVMVRMEPEERKLYDRMLSDSVLPLLDGKLSALDDMDSAVVGSTAAVLSNKLLQMANGAVYDDQGNVFHIHDQKLDALEELVESNGDNLLVFYEYKHDLDRILERFPQAKKFDGAEDIEAWNNGQIRMLLCHPASTAFGINLQAGGHTMVWFGLPWSLELHTQAVARLHRQGQEHPVVCHYILAENTLDERVYSVLGKKTAVQQSLLDALKEYVKDERPDL